MSRRKITRSKFDKDGNITPEVVAVVSAKDKVVDENNPQKYFKRNYFEALTQIIPSFYLAEEKDISGTHVSFLNQLINSHILANENQSTILPVSSLAGDMWLSSIGTPQGFARFFYKQSPLATVSPDDFERNILFPLDESYGKYKTSGAFLDFVSGTLLPKMPSLSDADINLATLTASAYDNTSSGTYRHLIIQLGWLYFLNRAGSSEFTPSAAVAELITKTLWEGQPVVLEDVINIYQEHVWKGQPTFGITDKIIPVDYVSSVSINGGTYTSGTQLLDRLKTLNTINYSPHFVDSPDVKIEESFTTYYDTSTVGLGGTLIEEEQGAGPLARFIQAISFSIADRLTEQDEIGILYDIGKCPDEFLELLAELIGWRFIGADIDKWRVQLRNAIEIYKMKGTRKSVQLLLDTLFSTGVFNITASSTLSELWESYIPDLMYYAIATNSKAFDSRKIYTPQVARQLGIPYYSTLSMHTNIQHAVDKILFDLVREFPGQFRLGGAPFPQLTFVYTGTDIVYDGPYHFMGMHLPITSSSTPYMTGKVHDSSSLNLTLNHDPNFVFSYRGATHHIPPYEKRQYYTQSIITAPMIDRIEFFLSCYGCDATFAKEVADYIREYINYTVDINRILNNFIIFTEKKILPPNYSTILRDVTKQKTPDPASLLSMWNGKSSHFMMVFDASSFDWKSKELKHTSSYGLKSVLSVLNQVIPAHAIPEILLSVSAVADALDALTDNDCREWRPILDDLYEGSSTVTTGFSLSAVDMAQLAVANGILPNYFKRTQVDNINDVLLSGNTFQARGSVNRNSLRRRNYHNLLPETKMFTRGGRNNPGSIELSSPYYSSALGYLPLGFMPSSLAYKEVALKQNTNGYGIGEFVDTPNVHPVWDICQNLTSPSSMFGYDISNTFASRAKQNVATSDCNTYGRRGQLQEIVYVMNSLNDRKAYLQASSIVSGFYDKWGQVDTTWPSSSPLITPTDLSAWYAEDAVYGGLNVVGSIANHLINKTRADDSLNYYEHFTFGYKVLKLYDAFNKLYKAHGTNNNYNLMGGANIFSHTYGPYIYNSDFDIDGSGLEVSGYLAASSPIYEVDLAYYGGSGVLSISGVTGEFAVGSYAASDPSDVYVGAPEFRNNNLVSSIELVDTSTPWLFDTHPIFSIFNMSRDAQSKWSYSQYLINNQIIKYHRARSASQFARLRIPIYPDSSELSENLLQPDHDYEITINAHNLDISSAEIGGLTLGVWIHTEPELDYLWSYAPKVQDECGLVLDKWTRDPVTNFTGDAGISFAISKAQTKPFTMGNLEDFQYGGEGGGSTTEDHYSEHCWEPWLTDSTIVGGNPLAITNVSEFSKQTFKFRFSTKNNKVLKRTAKYKNDIGKVHRADQKYVIEIFVTAGSDRKFVVFEDVSMIDLTNQSMAKVKSDHGYIDLGLQDLKAIFRYYKELSNGLASRNAYNTSAVMEVSGGSRLNYRSNVDMYANDRHSGSNQLEEITINEG
jgi:hypothetical protein